MQTEEKTPGDYHLALVDDWDGPRTIEQQVWLRLQTEKIEDPIEEICSLGLIAEIGLRRPDLVTFDSIVRRVRRRVGTILSMFPEGRKE